MPASHNGHNAGDGDAPAQSASIDSAGMTGVVSTLDTTLPPHTGPTPLDSSFNERLPIRFTGSGREYFRIWLVNLLLTLVTAGLYHPWAKVRRLRYFHANTLVAGQPLAFHGDPKKMLRSDLLVALLAILWAVAAKVSPVAGLAGLVLIALVWPMLFRASLQLRLANTSWRGLRFRFTGSRAGACRAVLPLFVPGAVVVASLAAAGDDLARLPGWVVTVSSATVLVTLLLAPLLLWNLKKYQHDHYAFSLLQTELRTGPGSVYGVMLMSFGLMLAGSAVAGAMLEAVGGLLEGSDGGAAKSARAGGIAWAISGVIVPLAAALFVQVVAWPYFSWRLQNLLWSRTGNRLLRFKSTLPFWPLLRLTLRNWLLLVLSAGLYWPFARVALARLRLESVSIVNRANLDALLAQAGEGGEAAAR